MFYDDFCKTDIEKTIFKEILKVQNECPYYMCVQDFSHLAYSDNEIKEVIGRFAKLGLFKHCVYNLDDDFCPFVFTLKD